MNGVHTTDDGDSRVVTAAPREASPGPAGGLMSPGEVAGDPGLTVAERREILASWASDARAVPGAPTLRQLDNGAVVRVEDVLRALGALGDGAGGRRAGGRRAGAGRVRPLARLRRRSLERLGAALWRRWSDDDDDEPPPCPAVVGRPMGGPLAGGEAVDAGLVLAA